MLIWSVTERYVCCSISRYTLGCSFTIKSVSPNPIQWTSQSTWTHTSLLQVDCRPQYILSLTLPGQDFPYDLSVVPRISWLYRLISSVNFDTTSLATWRLLREPPNHTECFSQPTWPRPFVQPDELIYKLLMLVSGFLSLPGHDHSDNLNLNILCGLRILPGNTHCSDTWQSVKWSLYSSWSHTLCNNLLVNPSISRRYWFLSSCNYETHILLPKCVNKIKNFRNCLQSQQCLPDKHTRCKWKPSIF